LSLTFVLLAGRLVYIQAEMSPRLLEWSERRSTGAITLAGSRGSILDRRHRTLAGTQDRPTVYADPRLIPDHSEAAERLAPILDTTAAELLKRLNKPTGPAYVVLTRGAEGVQVEAIQALDPRIPGV